MHFESRFLPPASAVEVIKSVPCFRLSVSTLTAEPFDIRTSNLVQGCNLTIPRMSLMGKVIGQGNQVEKCDFRSILLPFSALCDMIHYYGLKYGDSNVFV